MAENGKIVTASWVASSVGKYGRWMQGNRPAEESSRVLTASALFAKETPKV